MEIPGLFQCLFNGEDGMLQSSNVRWEGHLSVDADDCTKILATVQPRGTVQTSITGDGMKLENQMNLTMESNTLQHIPMVTGLELGQMAEIDGDRPSVIVTAGGTESLWDLAKRCGSTVSAIRAANGLEGEPIRGRMLLIPVI